MLEPFFIKVDDKKEKVIKRVEIMQVVRLTAKKNYTTISLINDTSYSVRTSLVNALKYFPSGMFVKIARGKVVSIFYIDNIRKDHLIMNGNTVPIAPAYYKYVVAGISVIE